MNKKIYMGKDAKLKLLAGVNQLADLIATTIGPKGRNVVIEQKNDLPLVINDGAQIAKTITLNDKLENMGAELLKQAAISTNELAGDGTTTATVLAQAILNPAIKAVIAGSNPILLNQGIDLAYDLVKDNLSLQKKSLSTHEEIINVASISSGHPKLGQLIAKAFKVVGKDGIITVAESKTTKSSLEVADGFEFQGGYVSPYMANNKTKMQMELSSVKILLVQQAITSLQPLLPLLETAAKTQQPLLIIGQDFNDDVITALVINNMKKIFHVLAVKPTNYFDRTPALFEDLSALTNAPYVSKNGINFANLTWENLPVIDKLVATKNKTVIINSSDSRKNVLDHVAILKQQQAQMELKSGNWNWWNERIARLMSGVAIIKIAATTELEQQELKYRIEDALNATKAAIQSGIIPGGGAGFLNAYKQAFKHLEKYETEVLAGLQIVQDALLAPMAKILKNAGLEPKEIIEEIINSDQLNYGYDALKNVFCDCYENGVIDPYLVCLTALEKACSVAKSIITTEGVVIDAPQEKNKFVFRDID